MNREVHQYLLAIENVWLRTEHQLETLTQIWNTIPEAVQDHQERTLSLLQEHLNVAIARVNELGVAKIITSSEDESVIPVRSLFRASELIPNFAKFKYATFRRNRLGDALANLEAWHRRFDPSWYLLLRLPANRTPKNQMFEAKMSPYTIRALKKFLTLRKVNRCIRSLVAFCLTSKAVGRQHSSSPSSSG